MDRCNDNGSMQFVGYRYSGGDPKMDKLIDDVSNSCKRHGAYTVRKAAIQQQNGCENALEDVGLSSYKSIYGDLLHISNLAFEEMTGNEILDEFYRTSGISLA